MRYDFTVGIEIEADNEEDAQDEIDNLLMANCISYEITDVREVKE